MNRTPFLLRREDWPYRMGILAVLIVAMSGGWGCSTSVNSLLMDQAEDFEKTVVSGVLLPHYLADTDVDPAAKQNMDAAVREHALFLAQVRGATQGLPQ